MNSDQRKFFDDLESTEKVRKLYRNDWKLCQHQRQKHLPEPGTVLKTDVACWLYFGSVKITYMLLQFSENLSKSFLCDGVPPVFIHLRVSCLL